MNKIVLILGGSSDISINVIKDLNNIWTNTAFIATYHCDFISLDKIIMSNQNTLDKLCVNLLNNQEVEALITYIKERYGTPTHIIHFAANKMTYEKFKNSDLEKLKESLQIQIYSPMLILQNFLPLMGKHKENDKIVFILSSVVLGKPPKYLSIYTMTKYLELGLMQSIAAEYAGKKININGLSPDMVETKFLSEIDKRYIEINAKNSVTKRIADKKEVSDVIQFLLSQESNYMHGCNLNVTGGNIF